MKDLLLKEFFFSLSKVLDMGLTTLVITHIEHHYKHSTSKIPKRYEHKQYMAKVPYASVVGRLKFSINYMI